MLSYFLLQLIQQSPFQPALHHQLHKGQQLCFCLLSRINFAVGSISTIVDGVCESIKRSLEAGNCSIDMSAFDEREDPFASLGSEYKQSKFYRDVFGLVD